MKGRSRTCRRASVLITRPSVICAESAPSAGMSRKRSPRRLEADSSCQAAKRSVNVLAPRSAVRPYCCVASTTGRRMKLSLGEGGAGPGFDIRLFSTKNGMGANGRDSKRIWAKRLKNWCFFEKRGLVMKNTFVLFAFVTCMAAQVRKAPEPDVSMSKSYDAPVEKVFGAMVQAASSYEIK